MSLSKSTAKSAGTPRNSKGLINHLPSFLQGQCTGASELNKGGFSEMLWNSATSLETDALQTDFIQGIKTGLLDPTSYGAYTVQDAVYCHWATKCYRVAEKKANGDELVKHFIQGRIKSYKEYTDFMFKECHIADPTAISMGHAAQSYSQFERNVAYNREPFYLLIAMLPCEALWIWLANQIKDGISATNVYSNWIEENMAGKHHLANFVDENVAKYSIPKRHAIKIYKEAMRGEVLFFQSATESRD